MQISVVFDVINNATQPLRNIEKNLSGVMRAMNKVQGCMWKFNQTSELFERMGNTVAQLSQPFRDFEQQMAELSDITGIVGGDLKRLGEVARRTGIESGLGATGAVKAFALLASQIDVDKIGMDGLIELQQRTITLAQAGGLSLEDAANAMAGTINQFGLQASEANRVINVMAAGSKYGAAEVNDLAMSFKVVGAAANAAGLKVEDVAGATEALSQNNLKGAEAGTALRNILLKMQTTLKVNFSKTSLAEALDKLKPKYRDAAYMAKVFGMENMAAAQFLIANSDAVAEMTKHVTDTNVAAEQAATNTDTWNQRLKVQAARFNEWSMRLTEHSTGIMNFIQTTSQLTSMLTSLSPLFAGIGTVVRGTIGAFGFVIGKVGTMVKFMQGLHIATRLSAFWTLICSKAQMAAAFMTDLWSKRTIMATAIQSGFVKALRFVKVAMIQGLLPALGGIIASTWAWTVALLANPVTWIVLGIMALVAAVVLCWNKFAGFRAVILTIWDAIKGFGKAVFQWIVAPFKAAYSLISGVVKAIGTLFKGGSLKDAGKNVAEGFSGAVDAYAAPVKTAAETATGISGNYDRHLAEERAKQAEKEREKEAKKGQSATMPGMEGLGRMDMGNISSMPQDEPSMTAAPSASSNVSVTYNPVINVSGDLTQKGREDLLKTLRDSAAEITEIIKEQLRKEGRGSYAVS
jgi:TP901 family phage tail tape measure protein